jgi:hypothetical protein
MSGAVRETFADQAVERMATGSGAATAPVKSPEPPVNRRR